MRQNPKARNEELGFKEYVSLTLDSTRVFRGVTNYSKEDKSLALSGGAIYGLLISYDMRFYHK